MAASLKSCPACQHRISVAAKNCPGCGHSFRPPATCGGLIGALLAVLLLFFLLFIAFHALM
jgi:predicted amidophosphoribosyltransferase